MEHRPIALCLVLHVLVFSVRGIKSNFLGVAMKTQSTRCNLTGTRVSYLDRIVIVDQSEKVIYDEMIRPQTQLISGQNMKRKHIIVVRKELRRLFERNVIVGFNLYALSKRLKTLHKLNRMRDLTFFCNDFSKTHGIHDFRTVAKDYLNSTITGDNATENAITFVRIYKKYLQEWKRYTMTSKPISLSYLYVPCVNMSDVMQKTLARITVVDHNYKVVYDKIIRPLFDVKYCLSNSNDLLWQDLRSGALLQQEKSILKSLITGRIVVGYDLTGALKVVEIFHPYPLQRDFRKTKIYKRLRPKKPVPSWSDVLDLYPDEEVEKKHKNRMVAKCFMQFYQEHRTEWDEEVTTFL